ncbi:MAG TPA: fumarylacetoacetate hydrolase family protein [Terriglobia bacterium]|jgi:2-keto-4-pentenoate hydratase/2-oxohepta-3-ene-1,7-dioic acid hydratase in catechol pathway|nr:fumarylacetoacetate hydrolase family protein [Terriglobia bacterium]
MKLVTYDGPDGRGLGVVEGESVVNVAGAIDWGGLLPKPEQGLRAAIERLERAPGAPFDMIDLIGRGREYLGALGAVTTAAAQSATEPGLVIPLSEARLRAPIARPPKITCVGLNYADHAREQGIEPPASPVFFLKSANTIIGPGDPIRLPPNTTQPDYEAELAVVIGKGGSRIPQDRVWEHVAGYTILNDVTARDMQHGDKQWFRGKSCDTFAPTGPWLVTADEIPDPHALAISLTLNGETMQDSNTSNLIYKIDFLISYLSQSLTWEAGDLVSTGTPPGVGVFRNPPVFIKPGDEISVRVEGIGTLTNRVVGP